MNFSIHNIIHILIVFVDLLLLIILLLKGKRLISNKLIALFFFAQILFSLDQLYVMNLNFNYKDYPFLTYIALPFYTVWAPCIYLYTQSQTVLNYRFKKKYFLHFLPLVLLSFYFLFFFHLNTIEMKKELLINKEIYNNKGALYYTWFLCIQLLIYNGLAIFKIKKYAKEQVLESDKIRARINWNKFIIYGYSLACFFDCLSLIIFIYTRYKNAPLYLHLSSSFLLIYSSIILGKALLRSHFGDEIKLSNKKQISKDEFDALKLALTELMKVEKPFLQFGLTLSELAMKLNVKERLLSKFINKHYQSTFQDFINVHRIEEAKELIKNSVNSGKTILEVVYESGFNSKSAFNYAFKKQMKITPTQYKKNQEVS